MTYLFILGNSPELASAELQAVLTRHKLIYSLKSFSNLLFVDLETFDTKIAGDLGGTVKVAKQLSEVNTLADAEKLVASSLNSPKVTFGLSFHHLPEISPLSSSKNIKRLLEEKGTKARFVLPRESQELSSVVSSKQNLSEFVFAQVEGHISVSRVLWLQDFASWGQRDYGRPQSAAHLGMLPPKVARMMINLALTNATATLLDPFCGTGTILAEALVLGLTVIGSDIDEAQLRRTRENLEWLQISRFSLQHSDARFLTLNKPIDCLVTEPDLGPNPGKAQSQPSPQIIGHLAGLYCAALQNWLGFLAPGARVVIALPSFKTQKEDKSLVNTVIDKAKIMGYSFAAGPYSYARPQARVLRNICVFQNGTH